MNKKQRVTLFGTTVILVLMLLFPPFYKSHTHSVSVVPESMGYHFIFTPPSPEDTFLVRSRIDFAVLFTQYLFITTIGGILYIAFKKKGE